jgi:hypothetical protein
MYMLPFQTENRNGSSGDIPLSSCKQIKRTKWTKGLAHSSSLIARTKKCKNFIVLYIRVNNSTNRGLSAETRFCLLDQQRDVVVVFWA